MQQDMLEFPSSRKKVITCVISTSKSFWESNFVILILWTSRDQASLDFLSRSQLVALMSMATHTSTTEFSQM
jgi:hypothetical protein